MPSEGSWLSTWTELLTHAQSGDHVVQLYGKDDPLLAKNVSRYLAEGMRRADGLVVIATPAHTQAIARHLAEEGASATREAERGGRLVFLDARATLDSLLVDGQPDEARFVSVVGGQLLAARERSGSGKVRAFGEMVSLLWSEGRPSEAERLETQWNALLSWSVVSLYCAYGLDLFGRTWTRPRSTRSSAPTLTCSPGPVPCSRTAAPAPETVYTLPRLLPAVPVGSFSFAATP